MDLAELKVQIAKRNNNLIKQPFCIFSFLKFFFCFFCFHFPAFWFELGGKDLPSPIPCHHSFFTFFFQFVSEKKKKKKFLAVKSSRNSTQIAVGAMISARLSAAAPEQLQIPQFPCKQGTSISPQHSFPGGAAAVYETHRTIPIPSPCPLCSAAGLGIVLDWKQGKGGEN